MRKLGLAIAYFVASVYVLLIVLPVVYCLQHGCNGPGELDAFMPAFALTPSGGMATAFALRNAIQNIRKKDSRSWAFWPLAIIFGVVLAGVIALVLWMVYKTAFGRASLRITRP